MTDQRLAALCAAMQKLAARGWLICMLALAAADPLWTLWRITEDGIAGRAAIRLQREGCEALLDRAQRADARKWRVEIKRDVVHLPPTPVPTTSTRYRCRSEDQEPQ